MLSIPLPPCQLYRLTFEILTLPRLGGFHLSGKTFEARIEQTIDELEKVKPFLVVANHCTGWKAMNRLAQRMPKAFALSTVGATFILESHRGGSFGAKKEFQAKMGRKPGQ